MARKILLADDSVTAQNMGRKILLDAGYEVITVNNGSAALKKIADLKPDLIVLDVYMPGYSGLEVCQRVKEDEDTARIPVLLTVGKLEPFKPEEARKARADAYIVKPFEASELLVALTKLEDKVVPPPGPVKPGRFAKAIAAAEQFPSEPRESFGDADSGWKKRLRFPTPASKAAAQASAESSNQPASADLPKDITPEEIAAIAAAAAQMGGAAQEPAAAHSSSQESAAPSIAAEVESAKSEPAPVIETAAPEAPAEPAAEQAPVTFASAPDAQAESTPGVETKSADVPVEAAASAESVVAASPATQETATQEAEPEAQPASVAAQAEASPAQAESLPHDAPEVASGPVPTDAEVVAALQTLSPANGDGSRQSEDAGVHGAEHNFEDNPMAAVLAAVASAEMAAAAPTGPRWVAESIALDAEEGTLILEREMEKAYAAFAAADGARASLAGVSSQASASVLAAGSLSVMAGSETRLEAVASIAVEPAPEAAPVNSVTPAEPVSEPVASQPESAIADAALQTASPPPTDQQEEVPATAVASESPAEAVAGTLAATAAEVAESSVAGEMAASAAAGIGGERNSTVTASAMQYPTTVPPNDRNAGGRDDLDRNRDSELDAATAAAWANWKQIRDTVVSASSQVTDVAAAAFKDIRQESPAKPEADASESASPSSANEASAIASIVESVLSELKPKLVEEIARKMAADKKKE